MAPASAFADRIVSAILNPLIFLLFALALLFFLWGLVVFVWRADNEEARRIGVRHMIWGIIGMFIMLSAYGIIAIIQNSFGL